MRGTGHAGSRTFAIGNEDHTIGNTLRHVLMQNAKVEFAGYSVPHPSEPVVHIRVQTAKTENRITAKEALRESCDTLYDQCAHVLEKLEEAIPKVKEDRIAMEEWKAKEEAEAAAAEEYMDDEDEEMMEGEDEEGGHQEEY